MKRAVMFTIENDELTVEDAVRAAMEGLMTRAEFTVEVIEACEDCDTFECDDATLIEVTLTAIASNATH